MHTLFIIEDDDNIRRGLFDCFDWNAHGILAVGSAADGTAALEELRTRHVDIILSDIVLPRMSGLEFAKRLRADGWDGVLIIMSAYDDTAYFQTAFSVEANDYLIKPIPDDRLGEALHRAVKRLEERKQNRELFRERRWRKLLNGEAADDGSSVYRLCLFRAREGIENLLLIAQSLSEETFVWADRITPMEATAIFETELIAPAEELIKRLIEADKNVTALISEIVLAPESLPDVLNELRQKLALGSLVNARPGRVPLLSMDKIVDYAFKTLLNGSAHVNFQDWFMKIWLRLIGSGISSMTDLQDRGQVFLMALGHRLSMKENSRAYEEWRRKSCTALFEIAYADEWKSQLMKCLKALLALVKAESPEARTTMLLEDCIRHNLTNASIGLLLDETGFSKWKIIRSVREARRQSVNEMIQGIRLNEAKRLLLETKLSVSEISHAVGYSSTDYFSSLFKKRLSLTPGQYRQRGSVE